MFGFARMPLVALVVSGAALAGAALSGAAHSGTGWSGGSPAATAARDRAGPGKSDALAALQRGAPPVAQPLDDALCEDCHPAETAGWRETGMARALGPVPAEALAGLASVVEASTGLVYRFAAGGDTPRLVETSRADAEHGASWPLAFAIGAGALDQSYALSAHGRWWFAPLEVVSADAPRTAARIERHAALAPPHAMRPGTRLDVPITSECLACHTDRLPPPRWPLNLAVDAATWEPKGISCGACHDAAAAHAVWREADLAGEAVAGDDPLRVHGDLTREQRLSVCAACHLQGDARLELVPGRFAIPAPGTDLLDVRALFVAAEADADVGFVSQVERLVLSACYLESGELDGGLVCETCHDPHRSVHAPAETARVRAACLGCHAGEHTTAPRPAGACGLPAEEVAAARAAGDDCAACHLPETPVFDVAGVRIHDHWIRARPTVADEPEELRADESPEGAWRRFLWPGVPPPPHAEDVGLELMALWSRGHAARAAALVDERPGPAAVRLPMYHHVKAGVLEHLGRPADAERAYRVALALDPDLVASRVNLGPLLALSGRADEALRLLSPLVEAYPRLDTAWRNRALAQRVAGDTAAFVADLEAAFRARPDPDVARLLAEHFTRSGDPDRARRWQAAASELAVPHASSERAEGGHR